MISFFVPGLAAAQGSKRHVGKGRMIEMSKRLGPWRNDVGREASIAMRGRELVYGPVAVRLAFHFPRPKGHFGSGRNSSNVKESAPRRHITTPDLDKLQRAINDAMTGIVWKDDSQVWKVEACKVYSGTPGVWIDVWDDDPIEDTRALR
jgi:crossover junction endodeoxyribonuclease RusA